MISVKNKYPNLYNFVKNRFIRDKFFGLPFSILICIFFINLTLLTEISGGVINSKNVAFLDRITEKLFYHIRNETIAKIFYGISLLGHPFFIFILGFGALILFIVKRKIYWSISTLISIIGSVFSVFLGKNLYHLDRPIKHSWYFENSFSFPSGHATIAVSFYGILIYYFIVYAKDLKKKVLYFIVGSLIIGLIGISRLYLGVHYFSDVIAGYLLGGIWLVFSIIIVNFRKDGRGI